MIKSFRSIRIVAVMMTALCLFCTQSFAAQLGPSGKDVTIYFDTGGPAGGPYNTVVQNGAL